MPNNARRSVPHRWARALFVLAALAVVAATVGLIMTTRQRATGTEPVTAFTATPPAPATAAEAAPATTVATTTASTTEPRSIGTGATTPAAPTMPPATTVALSPLAELLGERGSVIPEQIEPRVVPTALVIDGIGVFHPVRPVGLEDDGQLEIPDETEVGWYRYGGVPGRPGATVLAAHVRWNRTNGPFFLLRDLEPGSRIDVALADGSVRTYEAVERSIYDKDELPRDRIWRNTGDETLVLITCGGDYNPDIRRYRQNVVVYAVPVADDAPAGGEDEDAG